MEKLKLILKNKKEKSQTQVPKYAMRKLSIGFVSCFLGCAVFMAPSIVNAEASINSENTEIVTYEDKKEPVEIYSIDDSSIVENTEEKSKDKSQDEDELLVAEVQSTPAKEVVETETQKALVEEVVAEIETQDEAEATPAEAKLEEKDAEELEVSDQVDPTVQKEAGSEAEATPISAETGVIKNVEITIGGADNGDKTTTVNPTASDDRIDGEDTDLNLKTRIDFDIPEGTRSGSTFDIIISDNVNFNGIVKEEKIKPIEYNGDEIATGEKLTGDKRGYKYTFNENIDNLTDIRVRLEYPFFIDPKAVPGDSQKETVKVSLAGEDGTVIGENSKDFAVEYEKGVFEVDPEAHTVTVSGSANITNVTKDTYEHVIYVNPTGDQGLTGSHVEIKNQVYDETYTDDYGNERTRKKAYDSAIFDDDVKNSVKVYKIKDKDKFNLSYDLDGVDLEDVTEKATIELVEPLFEGNKYLKIDVNQENHDDSVYVVKYTGKRKPNQATKTNVEFTADSRQMEGYETTAVTKVNGGWFWTNEILFDDPKTLAEASKVYNLGDRVWIDTNKNGIQDDDEVGLKDVKVTLNGDDILPVTVKTDADGKYLFKKLRDGSYTVEFEIKEGYEPTTANAKGSTEDKDSDASVAEGAEVATATGKIEGADNMNVDFGVIESEVKKGSFKETHVYITKDFEGNVVEDMTITEAGKSSEGKKDESYTSAKVDKDGYEFTKVSADQGSDEVTISENGKQVESGNYVEDKELAVTYEYVKQPGRFIEHHIYKTVDKDGKVISTDETVDVTEKDGKKIEGFSNESINTDKKDKDGYTFKEATEIKLQNDDSEKTYTNYVPGKVLEKTYIYTKTKEEPTTPVSGDTDPKEDPKQEEPKPTPPESPEEPKDTPPIPVTPPSTPVEPVTNIPNEPVSEVPAEPQEPKENTPKVEETIAKVEEKETATPQNEDIVKDKKIKKNKEDDGKAPQTFDPGVAPYIGLGSIATAALAYLEDKKRKRK